MNKTSLSPRLMGILTICVLLFALLAATISGVENYHEIEEIQDDMLMQAAAYINPKVPFDANISLADDDRQIHADTDTNPHPERMILNALTSEADGFHNIEYDGEHYRVFVRNTPHGQVRVWQESDIRQEMAMRAAIGSALPLLLLIPILLMAIAYTIWRTLRPVQKLSDEIAQRHTHDLTPLSIHHIPREIHGLVQAINQMLMRTERAMQQQQRFIADAAHELRTPMTALNLQIERLCAGSLHPEQFEQTQALQQSIQRQRHLLEQLLTHARVQAAERRNGNPTHAMHTIFRRVLSDVLPLAHAKQQDIGIASTDDVLCCIDETDAYVLMKTLVDNAIRYTDAGSQIDLRAELTPHAIILSVEDNGHDITAEERERVLEPFYRILGTGEDGTGLGLAIAQTVAQQYGGKIILRDSVHHAHGLLVEVHLPHHSVAMQAACTQKSPIV